MANHKEMIPFILSFEGGFSNNPTDRGGATNKGVTLNTFTNYRGGKGMATPTVEDLKNISSDEWGDIFRCTFWKRIMGDKIDTQSIANIFVDWVWASGGYNPTRMIQEIVGSFPDGIVGNKTIYSINTYPDQKELFNKIKARRLLYVDRVILSHPEQYIFKNGWNRRINSIGYGSLKLNK